MPEHHIKYKKLKDLQKLRLLGSEIAVSENMQRLLEANKNCGNAIDKLGKAEKELDDVLETKELSLDILLFRQDVLTSALEDLELAETYVESAEVTEQDSREKYHKHERQFDQLAQLNKKFLAKYDRRIDEKNMADITALLLNKAKEKYNEN